MLVTQKHRAIIRHKKMAFSLTVGSPWDPPSPPPESVRTGEWAYADVRTEIFRMDRLPELLIHGVPLVRFACVSSAISK